jgi:hypothetical protein
MGEDVALPALKELTVIPVLLTNWMQLHGWMPADAEGASGQAGAPNAR